MDKEIIYDLIRYEGNSNSHFIKTQLKYLFFCPGFTFTYFFRKACKSNLFLWKVLHRITMYITGIQIPVGTQIGKGLRIIHWGAIVINPETIIGDNFNIAQGVLIGSSLGKKQGTPIIGNNVYVGANAIVVGGVKIGNNVLIAPGAFINFDCPDNSIVIGNPGQIVPRHSSPTKKYIKYPV